ncbi:MAG: GNAT family N-acetyltransferase [Chitinophagales bacterium]
MKQQIIYRQIKSTEHFFLEEMLYEALFVPVGKPRFSKSILNEPTIRKYINNWNESNGDIAILALHENELIGAIWGRKFQIENKGYGYIDNEIPEISMAIKEKYRNKGIGTTLLHQIELKYIQSGVCKISLSVAKQNPARFLYERNGYKFYEENGTAITMIKKL